MSFRKHIGNIFIAAGLMVLLISCNNGDVDSKGTAHVSVTDAPIDTETISGIHLSVIGIHAMKDGEVETVTMFDTAKVFNVMDYQNGSTYELGAGQVDAGIYEELRLILDEDSYVEFEDESTEPLIVPSGTSSGYKIKGDYQISINSTTNLVIDIDLRKAFTTTGTEEYILRPVARLVNEENTGTITGTVSANEEDRVVIYAYAEGTYDETEDDEPLVGHTRFENSINSAVVDENGAFTLAFMPPDDYELIAATYTYNETEGTFEFKSASKAEVSVSGSVISVVEIDSETDVDVLLTLTL